MTPLPEVVLLVEVVLPLEAVELEDNEGEVVVDVVEVLAPELEAVVAAVNVKLIKYLETELQTFAELQA